MYSRLQLARKYLHYYLSASNGKGHGIHSPFVFDFVKNVLNDPRRYDAYDQVENLRKGLMRDDTVLEVRDMGAGSSLSGSRHRKVSEIARNAAKPKKYGQLLFRLAQYYQAHTTLELGTSLGLTTAYLAKAGASVISLEGAPEVARIAGVNLEKLGLTNVDLRQGNFDDLLAPLLETIPPIDLAFIDGNHRKDPTLQYFRQLSRKMHDSSILVFDDIHWSSEMEEAWEVIKADQAVTLTIDLFFLGFVFFKKEFKIKQHFTVWY